MKSLPEYLDDEFTLVNKHDLLAMLEQYQLLNIIEKLIQQLKDNPCQALDIGVISSSVVISVNNNISIPEHEKRQKIESLFADLVFMIFIDFLKNKPIEYPLILKEIKRHTFTTCNLMGYDFNVFKKLIDAHAFSSINAGYGSDLKTISHPVEVSKSKILWTGKGRLEELVYQLGRRKLIKNKTSFFDLFLKTQSEHVMVKWDFERKGHLAFLLCELYKKDLINVTSNRGYFSYAEKHFISFDGAALKANSLKKLSSAIHMQPQHYPKIINDVTEIIDKVSAVH
ncbi:MAG TPA: hypothetical protein VNX40_11330 [Mucilaginibacter sp.]|jgi:hypothetical protein|nr:hypothetical protein [Mucilaginibacter sp.]